MVTTAYAAETLTEAIESHVQPDSWRDCGGAGCAHAFSGSVMVVSQSWAVHHQVRLFLRKLRAALDAPAGSCTFVVSPDQQSLLTALQRRVTYAGRDRPFREVLAALSESVAAAVAAGPVAVDPDVVAFIEALDPAALTDADLDGLLAASGLVDPSSDGTLALPEQMAPVNAMLDVASPAMREALLVAFLDRLSRPVRGGAIPD